MVFSTVPLQSKWGNLHPEPSAQGPEPPTRSCAPEATQPHRPGHRPGVPCSLRGPPFPSMAPYSHTEKGKTGPLNNRGWGHSCTRRKSEGK